MSAYEVRFAAIMVSADADGARLMITEDEVPSPVLVLPAGHPVVAQFLSMTAAMPVMWLGNELVLPADLPTGQPEL